MAVERLSEDLDIIAKLDDEPNDVGGVSAAELKARFDRAGNIIKGYINETLLPAIDGTGAAAAARAEQAAKEAERWAGQAHAIAGEDIPTRPEAQGYVADHDADPAAHADIRSEISDVAAELEESKADKALAGLVRSNGRLFRIQTGEVLPDQTGGAFEIPNINSSNSEMVRLKDYIVTPVNDQLLVVDMLTMTVKHRLSSWDLSGGSATGGVSTPYAFGVDVVSTGYFATPDSSTRTSVLLHVPTGRAIKCSGTSNAGERDGYLYRYTDYSNSNTDVYRISKDAFLEGSTETWETVGKASTRFNGGLIMFGYYIKKSSGGKTTAWNCADLSTITVSGIPTTDPYSFNPMWVDAENYEAFTKAGYTSSSSPKFDYTKTTFNGPFITVKHYTPFDADANLTYQGHISDTDMLMYNEDTKLFCVVRINEDAGTLELMQTGTKTSTAKLKMGSKPQKHIKQPFPLENFPGRTFYAGDFADSGVVDAETLEMVSNGYCWEYDTAKLGYKKNAGNYTGGSGGAAFSAPIVNWPIRMVAPAGLAEVVNDGEEDG